MTNAELIAAMQALPPDAPTVFWCSEGDRMVEIGAAQAIWIGSKPSDCSQPVLETTIGARPAVELLDAAALAD